MTDKTDKIIGQLTSGMQRRAKEVSRAMQRAQQEAFEKSDKKSGSGSSGFFRNEIVIAAPRKDKDTGKIIEPDTEVVRFLAGDYAVPPHMVVDFPGVYREGDRLPYYTHQSYYHPGRGKMRNGMTVLDTRDWCNGDDLSRFLMDNDPEIKPRPLSHYSVVHLGRWHKVQKQIEFKDKKTGDQVTTNVTNLDKCRGKVQCVHCKNGNEAIYGRSGYVRLSPAMVTCVEDIEREISGYCLCGCSTPLKIMMYSCSRCGYVFGEAGIGEGGEIEDALTLKDLAALYSNHSVCPQCKERIDEMNSDAAQIAETLACNGCMSPQRATLYDADVALRKTGMKSKTRLELDREKFDHRGFIVRPLNEQLRPLVQLYDFWSGLKVTPDITAKLLALGAAEWDDYQEFVSSHSSGYQPRKQPRKANDPPALVDETPPPDDADLY